MYTSTAELASVETLVISAEIWT